MYNKCDVFVCAAIGKKKKQKKEKLKQQLNTDEYPFSPLLTCRPPHPSEALYSHLLYFISVGVQQRDGCKIDTILKCTVI